MASDNYGVALRGIERIFNQGSLTGLSEGQLLRQFATGDEGAFEALVTRHGPMVLGVCRRLLYDRRDVEDAFQATFLVLLRKAGALRDAEALSPWLHGVAYRVAARIRCNSIQRPLEESKGARPEAAEPECDLERTELRSLIDEEIRRLPEKYRRPVVLCYLEGKTHEEAARRLRCSVGSVRGPLAGATVAFDGWRGNRTLDWRMTTDDEGEFQWTDAPPGYVLGGHLARGLPSDQPARGAAGRWRLDDRVEQATESAGDRRRRRDPPCGQVVHPGAGDGERWKFFDLLGPQRGAAYQERAVRDSIRRYDATARPPAPRRGRWLHAGGDWAIRPRPSPGGAARLRPATTAGSCSSGSCRGK